MFLWFLPGSNKCVARNFGHDSVVCECNSTYCDSVGSVTLPPLGQYLSYLSSRAGSRLEAGQGQIHVNSTGAGEWAVHSLQCQCQCDVDVFCSCVSFLQASGWLLFPTRSIRRLGGLVELWQMQQQLTSCPFLLEYRTSCYDSTSPKKVRCMTQSMWTPITTEHTHTSYTVVE